VSETGVREYPDDEDMTEGIPQFPGDEDLPVERRVPRMDCGEDERRRDAIRAAYSVQRASNNVSVSNQIPQRKYLPTLSDLVDRLSIVQLKAINIPERSEEYVKERALIEHDIDLILSELAKDGKYVGASAVHAILVIMLSNHFIWINETKAREGGSEQDKLLKMTHSINGVRNTAKNQLANIDGGRRDYKVDALSAELTAEFGNWNIW
jgi:hypothetical protein